MQQTKFDRWLRGKYAYITRIYSNTSPAEIPAGIEVANLDIKSGAPYRFRYSSIDSEAVEALARQLDRENITYTSRVEDRDVWYGKFINNPKKSFSYRLFWIGCLLGILIFGFSSAPKTIWNFLIEEEGNPKQSHSNPGTGASKDKFAELSGRFDPNKN